MIATKQALKPMVQAPIWHSRVDRNAAAGWFNGLEGISLTVKQAWR
jgi:hypothetical protein